MHLILGQLIQLIHLALVVVAHGARSVSRRVRAGAGARALG